MVEVSSGQKKSNGLLLPFLKSWENKKTGIKLPVQHISNLSVFLFGDFR